MSTETLKQAVDFLRANPNTYLGTVDGGAPWVRAMWTARVDDDGTLWYATALDTNKVRQIAANPNVCVSEGNGNTVVRMHGTAAIVTEQAVKDAFWEESWTVYFPSSADPGWGLIKVTPKQVEFNTMER